MENFQLSYLRPYYQARKGIFHKLFNSVFTFAFCFTLKEDPEASNTAVQCKAIPACKRVVFKGSSTVELSCKSRSLQCKGLGKEA